MTCDYEDGSFEDFDCSVLEIIEPVQIQGQKFHVYFSAFQEMDATWKIIGKHVKFSILEDHISQNNIVFEGALKNIEFE